MDKNYKVHIRIFMLFSILAYLGFHFISLTKYPFVHSDEAWLSGLSRTVLHKSTFNVSEGFFDLYPRAIHALRLVFVSIQIFFTRIFGYSIFSFRLISLIFASASLIILYLYYKKNEYKLIHILVFLIAIGFNIQFVHTSHIARQEPIILFGMIVAYTLTLSLKTKYRSLIIASCVGLMIGVHPNSFLIGLSIGLIILYKFIVKEMSLKELFLYIGVLSLWAFLFIFLSYYLNSNFLSDYMAFGDQLGVTNNDISRLQGLYYYYYKIYHQIGGTYLLPNISLDLFILLFSTLISLLGLFNKNKIKDRNYIYPLLMIIGINLGYLIIGRYNQTAIIFVVVFAFITFFELLRNIPSKRLLSLILIVFSLLEITNTYKIISSADYQDYNEIASNLNEIIPRDKRVLANLNLDYHFDLYQLYDYRNLDYLDEHEMSFKDYIEKNSIDYIILYDEMEYIYENRPKWNILYGDLNYYEDMIDFTEKKCTLIHEIKMPTYAIRIAKYVDVLPWKAKVYKVN